MDLTDIADFAPFVERTGRFEVFGRDPAQLVEADHVVTMGFTGHEIGRTASAAEAVSLAVRNLPADLDPVAYGAVLPD